MTSKHTLNFILKWERNLFLLKVACTQTLHYSMIGVHARSVDFKEKIEQAILKAIARQQTYSTHTLVIATCGWEKHKASARSPGGGEGGTRPIFEYSWAAEGLKPCPSLGQKIPKIHTLFKTTRSILVPCLWPNALLIIRTDSQKSCTLFRTDLYEIIYPV